MDNEKLLKVLKYAKLRVTNPEPRYNFNHVIVDGYYPPTIGDLKKQLETRLEALNSYQDFFKDLEELIAEIEITTNER